MATQVGRASVKGVLNRRRLEAGGGYEYKVRYVGGAAAADGWVGADHVTEGQVAAFTVRAVSWGF